MRKTIFAAAVLVVATSSNARNLEYDVKAGPKRDALVSLLVRTVVCMRDATTMQLRAGMRDDNDIATGTAMLCGTPLGKFMVAEMGFTKRDAATYLFAMGHAAIKETPGVK